MLVRPFVSLLLVALALVACSSEQTPIKAEGNAKKLDKTTASWSDSKDVRPDPPLDAGMDGGPETEAGPGADEAGAPDAGPDATAPDAGDGG